MLKTHYVTFRVLPRRLIFKTWDNSHSSHSITERSRSFHIQKALEMYLGEQADLQIALDRLHDTSDPAISINEMRDELDV